jgi:hypothetical protein
MYLLAYQVRPGNLKIVPHRFILLQLSLEKGIMAGIRPSKTMPEINELIVRL